MKRSRIKLVIASVLGVCLCWAGLSVYKGLLNEADMYSAMLSIGAGIEQYRERRGSMPSGVEEMVKEKVLPEVSLIYTIRASGLWREPRSYRQCEYVITFAPDRYEIQRPAFRSWFRSYRTVAFARRVNANGGWSGGFVGVVPGDHGSN